MYDFVAIGYHLIVRHSRLASFHFNFVAFLLISERDDSQVTAVVTTDDANSFKTVKKILN